MREDNHIDALRYSIGKQELEEQIGKAINEELVSQLLESRNQVITIGLIGGEPPRKVIVISSDIHHSSMPNIEEMIERINGPKLIQDTVFEYKKEDEIEPNYLQKKPSIFSKTIRCQKPTKKPYIKRLRRVIRM